MERQPRLACQKARTPGNPIALAISCGSSAIVVVPRRRTASAKGAGVSRELSMWRWLSTRPGAAIWPSPSSVSRAARRGNVPAPSTAAIRPFAMATSAGWTSPVKTFARRTLVMRRSAGCCRGRPGSGTRRCLMDCTAYVGATPASPVGRRPTVGVSRNVVALRATGDACAPLQRPGNAAFVRGSWVGREHVEEELPEAVGVDGHGHLGVGVVVAGRGEAAGGGVRPGGGGGRRRSCRRCACRAARRRRASARSGRCRDRPAPPPPAGRAWPRRGVRRRRGSARRRNRACRRRGRW